MLPLVAGVFFFSVAAMKSFCSSFKRESQQTLTLAFRIPPSIEVISDTRLAESMVHMERRTDPEYDRNNKEEHT